MKNFERVFETVNNSVAALMMKGMKDKARGSSKSNANSLAVDSNMHQRKHSVFSEAQPQNIAVSSDEQSNRPRFQTGSSETPNENESASIPQVQPRAQTAVSQPIE